MPTVVFNFSDADIRMRYREPFLTEGLDIKMSVNTPPGIYRGFRLAASGSNLSVTVAGDTMFGDSAAVYETSAGHSLSIRRSGSFDLDLSAFASKVVVVAIYATYALGADTTAEIRVYEWQPTDTFTVAVERPELVVLGAVVVPASGLIPAGALYPQFRTSAWGAVAPEATPWTPVIKNGGFEWAHDAQTYKFAVANWELSSVTGGNWRSSSSLATHSGSRALQLNVTSSPINAKILQRVGVPVPAGRWVRIEAWVKSLIAPTTAVQINLNANWIDANGNSVANTNVPLVVVGATDTAWRLVEAVFVAEPTTAFLDTIDITASNQTYGSTGVALLVDDVQVFVEVPGPLYVPPDDFHTGQGHLSSLVVDDPTLPVPAALAALLRFDKSTPASEGELIVERKDQDYTGGKLPPALAHYGRLVNLGRQLLNSAADARKARISTPYHTTFDATLIWESTPTPGTTPSVRLYVSLSGLVFLTVNAYYDGTNWNKDSAGSQATLWEMLRGHIDIFFRDSDTPWTTWSPISKTWGPRTTTLSTPYFSPLLELFDSGGNRRVVFDHNGLPAGRYHEIHQNWMSPMYAAFIDGIVGTATNTSVLDTGLIPGPALRQFVAVNTDRATKYSQYRPLQGPLKANVLHVLEWEVDATDLVGTPALVYEFGFIHDESVEPSSEDYVKVYKSSASANWQFMTQGLTASQQDTGVAAAAAAQRFRIEVYGSALPGGLRALCYIDGILRAEITDTGTNLPQNDQMAIVSFFKSTGAASKQVIVSPVWYRATRYLADDSL